MIPMVVVVLAEEHRERIRADDRLRSYFTNDEHQLAPQGSVVLELSVRMTEKMKARQPEDLRRPLRLSDPRSDESVGVCFRIRRALVTGGADEYPDLATGGCPPGKRATTRDVRIVG